MTETILDLDQPIFSTAECAAIANVTPNNIRAWQQRGHLKLSDFDKEAEGNGKAGLLTPRTVLMIAIAGEMLQHGLAGAPSVAIAAAHHFMWHGAETGGRRRLPGHLYQDGRTFLVVPKDRSPLTICMLPNDRFQDFWRANFIGASFFVLEVDETYVGTMVRMQKVLKAHHKSDTMAWRAVRARELLASEKAEA